MLETVLVDPPSLPPVTLEQVKNHCRIDGEEEDDLLSGYLEAAVGYLDGPSGILGRCMVEQIWRLELSGFPNGLLRLPVEPVISVNLNYQDSSGEWQTVDPSTCFTGQDSSGYFIKNKKGRWPEVLYGFGTVRLDITAGFGGPDKVPAAIKQALLLLTSFLYETRGEAEKVDLPQAVYTLLSPFRRIAL